jgi:hypothetical protein
MAFEITQTPRDANAPSDDANAEAASEFHVSHRVLVHAGTDRDIADTLEHLPRSDGGPSLCLMPRDARSLFVYWDIDWEAAFRDEMPPDRQAHLRLLKADGSIETTTKIEPMACSCEVTVSSAGACYSAELGWFKSPGVWVSVATSDPANTPPDRSENFGPIELTTVPFHLTFQRMLDLLRVPKYERGSLSGILADLRERAGTTASPHAASGGEEEVIRAMRDAVAEASASNHESSGAPRSNEAPISVWNDTALRRVLGLGSSSATEGLGSSRTAVAGS